MRDYKKIAETRRKNNNTWHRKETIEKIRKANTGKKFTKEHKRKISDSKKGKPSWNKGVKGYITSLRGQKRSKEWCKNISKSHTGKNNPMFGKKRPIHSQLMKENNPSKRPEVREKLRKKRQQEILLYNKCMQIGKNEKRILDELELSLGYDIIRQLPICGYWLDGYIPELNLAIEVDEKHHKLQIKKDLERQNNIQEKLNCYFVRILCVE